LLDKAVACGLRSLFIGFETINPHNLETQHKPQNLNRNYDAAIRQLHGLGVMVNGSFVFGIDDDDETVFDRTVDWAVRQGIETATFHILTPYPGTALHRHVLAEDRITTSNWDLYDTRHAVFHPARMSAQTLEDGYWHAYKEFYRWKNILASSRVESDLAETLRHLGYVGAWKKFEPLWDWVIRAKRVGSLLPALEGVLAGFGGQQKSRKELPAATRLYAD
jgi:radical SAM superfamily enzyme YgiQ (UPF0313 family)